MGGSPRLRRDWRAVRLQGSVTIPWGGDRAPNEADPRQEDSQPWQKRVAEEALHSPDFKEPMQVRVCSIPRGY